MLRHQILPNPNDALGLSQEDMDSQNLEQLQRELQLLRERNRLLEQEIRQYEALLEVLPVGIGIATDRDCLNIITNSAMARILNMNTSDNASLTAPEEERPRHFRVFHNGEEIAPDDLPMQRSAREGIVIENLELEIKREDGVSIHLLVYAAPLYDEWGEICGSVGAFADISALKEINRKLEEKELFTLSILDSSPDCIKVINEEGQLILMNDAGLRQMEVSQDFSFTGKSWVEFWNGEERALAEQAIQDAMEGRTGKFEGFCPTAADTPKWWEVLVTPIRSNAAKSCQLLVISRDITERKHHEMILQEKEQNLRQLADSMPQMVWVTRPDGYHEYYNQRWYEFTGMAEGSTDGEAWDHVFHPEDQPRAWKRWRQSLQTGKPYEIEYRLRRADGVYRWVLGRALPIYNDKGEIVRWYGTCTDIEEQKRIQRQLIEARNAAESANLAKSEFLANMSHEIRTPMNAVIGLSNILAMSKPLTTKQQEYIKTLQMSADSLLALINDLLDISKIETRTLELESIPFSLARIAQEAASMLNVKVQEKGLQFHMEAETIQHFTYRGDPSRIRQMMLNLLSNAVKFTEEGSVRMVFSAKPLENQPIHQVSLTVEDTGIGIPHDKLETIFDKFIQADSSINRKYGGTGLGLAITKTLTEIMGGSIQVESTPGMGSRFTITLPLPVHEEERLTSKNLAETDENIENESGFRVLLVEDYAPNILVAGSFLQLFGYAYEVAHNGIEAVEMAKTGRFHATLMDVQMHGMNGLEATRLIRAYEAQQGLPPLPIIGMTAHAMSGDRERCLGVGMDDYISKPFNAEELRTKLQQYEQRAGLRAGR
jgi:PAS domain S-box-containing protein